jgi:hypothetical protein
VDCYRPVAIEAFVGVIVIRNIWGFGFTFAVAPWLTAEGVRSVTIAITIITVGFYLTTIPMYIYGKRLRIWTSTRYPLAGKKLL